MVATSERRQADRSLSSMVEALIDEFPGFDEYDLAELIEERLQRRVREHEWQAVVRVLHRRQLQAWVDEDE